MDSRSDISAVAALDEPARRRLYEYVCAQPGPVGRDQTSSALHMPRRTAAFHLDKLVEVGLLTTEFARLSGRTGPGAGRPSKLYRRVPRPVSVQLPDRAYEAAAHVLAQTIEDADPSGTAPPGLLAERASELGRASGAAFAEATHEDEEPAPGDAAAGVIDTGADAAAINALTHYGYEPRFDDDDREFILVNCPFHSLAQRHTELVCGMNLGMVKGILEGVGCSTLNARLAPDEQYCCVRLTPGTGPRSDYE